ncbi:MAG: GNAT family N-acetyltransferase [Solirubrobacteraceae bacterium]|nr:GNAT family N-acetyltransferase [Solirubrobacteraceae bacterium]
MSDPLDRVMWPVETERLMLRRAEPEDWAEVYAYTRLKEVADYAGGQPDDEEEFEEKWASEMVLNRIVVLLDGAIIGYVMLRIYDAWAQPEVRGDAAAVQAEVGYTFAPEAQGQGYATEAVRAVIDLSFGPIGLRRVTASVFTDNEPSWRLLERLGMRREAHTIADSLHRDRGWLDGYDYALLATEWTR